MRSVERLTERISQLESAVSDCRKYAAARRLMRGERRWDDWVTCGEEFGAEWRHEVMRGLPAAVVRRSQGEWQLTSLVDRLVAVAAHVPGEPLLPELLGLLEESRTGWMSDHLASATAAARVRLQIGDDEGRGLRCACWTPCSSGWKLRAEVFAAAEGNTSHYDLRALKLLSEGFTAPDGKRYVLESVQLGGRSLFSEAPGDE